MIRVLIVEDDPMVAHINKKYTESLEGFKVVGVFSDGRAALNEIKKGTIDLIILDVYMPKLDGISLLKTMRKENIMTDVIMITAAQEVDKLNEVLKLGAVDYLVKPFEYERFKEAFNKYRIRYNLLHDKNVVNQEDIDLITSKKGYVNNYDIRKGLHKKTLERVREFMRKNKTEFFTSEEVAENLGLTRVTIRKYMEYLTSVGELRNEIEYGTIGRPRHKYKYC